MTETSKPTRAEWDAAQPFTKGYWSQLYGGVPGNDIPAESPYESTTIENAQFGLGFNSAARQQG